MRYPPGHKEQTRARIVEAAGRVFRRVGYGAAGLDKVMEEAGLTVGGFYAHFDSKQALLAEVLARAADGAGVRLPEGLGDLPADEWLDGFLGKYLSMAHRGRIEEGCPLAALVSEVSRTPEAVRSGSEAIVRELAAKLASHGAGGEGRAFAALALCVGGLGLARAVEDEAMAAKILDECRSAARAILADPASE